MIPKLYQKDGTTLIGTLTNCIACLVEEERNGIFEVTLQYPNNETISASLVYDNIIICDSNDTLKNQKFRIYDTRRMMNNTIEVYARHISFDLAYDHIDSIDITNQSCEYALNTIFRNTQFSAKYVGHSDIINAQNYKISNCNALEAIAGKKGSIIDTYGTGAEIFRDNIDIYVLNKRGNDNGVSIEYAKNLTGFELQENTDDLITRILPYATYTPEGGTQTRVDGPSCDSQYITNYSHPFIAEIDFSEKFEDGVVPTASKLQTLAEQYFNNNKCDLPKQNWKIEFIPLSKCVGYEGIEDAISLCDTVTIVDTRYNINTKAKVIKTKYDVLRERYDSMELGEPRTTLGDIVNSSQQQGEQGPPGPQGPKGEDGNIGDFPDSLPSKPVLTATLLGFASIQLDWTYENKPYYWYEVYASKTKNFTPNTFDIIHKGQTSSFLYQAKPGETWYFRVCGINSYDHRGTMSDQIEVVTTLVDNLENYFTTAAIGQAVVGSLTADYMTAGIIKGNWIDAKNLSVTDGNGKRTLDIDSYGNVNLDVTEFNVRNKSFEYYLYDDVNLIPNPSALYGIGTWTAAGTAGCSVYRYETTANYIPPVSGNTSPYISGDDLFGNVEIYGIALPSGGLSMIIRDCTGKVIMIDGGHRGEEDNTIAVLNTLGVKKINYYIVTHSHSDHSGAVPKILDTFGAECVVIKESRWDELPAVEIEWETKQFYDSIINKCKELNIPVLNPTIDSYLKISDYSYIQIFNSNSTNKSDYNFQSLMCLYVYKDSKFFFAGDGIAEAALAPLNQVGKVNLLQLGHHGEGSWPQDQKLIDELQPKYAYYASNLLDTAFNGGTDPINTKVSLDRVSFWGGYSVTHGSHSNPGNVVFVLDGINITTTANAIKSTSRWYLRDGEYYYFKSDSTLAINEWEEIDSEWYRFGEDKIMYRNKWFKDHDENWFYFGDNGAMYKDTTVTIDGKEYTFNSNGVCINPNQ